jgi:tetratricopeptide (TPR) repeat protein
MSDAHREEIAKLEALYDDHPEGRIFTHLAEAYRKAGELDRAFEVLTEGIERHPEYSSAHVVLGRVHMDRGQGDQAAAEFQRVLELDPQNLVATRCLGDLARAEGDREAALEHYRQLQSVEPSPEVKELIDELTLEGETASATGLEQEPVAEVEADEVPPAEEEPVSPAEEEESREPVFESEETTEWVAAEEPEEIAAEEPEGPVPQTEETVGSVFETEEAGEWSSGMEESEEPVFETEEAGEWSSGMEESEEPVFETEEPAGATEDVDLEAEAADEAVVREAWASEEASQWEAPAAEDHEVYEPADEVEDEPADEAGIEASDEPTDEVEIEVEDEVEAEAEIGSAAEEGEPVDGGWPVVPTTAAEEVADEAAGEEPEQEQERAGAGTTDVEEPWEEDEETVDIEEPGALEPEAEWAEAREDEWAAEPEEAESEQEVRTETIAWIYARQGLYERAADVYRELLRNRPDDPELAERLAEMEELARAAESDEEPVFEDEAAVAVEMEERDPETGLVSDTMQAGGADQLSADVDVEDVPGPPGVDVEDASSPTDVDTSPPIREYFDRLLAWSGTGGTEGLSAESGLAEATGVGQTATPTDPEGGTRPEPGSDPGRGTEPEAGGGAEPRKEGSRHEGDDDDLEMFRSWLESLKQ